jgi:uncharacterized membrane protein
LNRTLPASIVFLVVLSLAGNILVASAATFGSADYVTSTTISVYGDGSATVNQTLSVPQNATSIVIPLFSSQVGDILVLDQNVSPLSYQIGNQSMTIYTLGASLITLVYDTDGLTTKQGAVWTASFNASYDVSLTLPYQATIISVSATPVSVSSQDGSPELVLGPGTWMVSYGLPIAVSGTMTASSTRTSNTVISGPSETGGNSTSSTQNSSAAQQAGASNSDSLYLAIGVLAVAALAIAALYVMRRKKPSEPLILRPDDVEMLRFIKESGGEVSEAAVREHFGLPRTSAWRQAKRLEAMGYVKITKVGSQNQVKLLKDDFEPS